MGHHSPIRWYNPTLEDFEWRKVPRTDEQALKVLDLRCSLLPLPGMVFGHPYIYHHTRRRVRSRKI